VRGGFDLKGTEADDLITGTNLIDRIYGEGGNDALYGGRGDDVLSGGDGSDSLCGGLGNDTLLTGEGDDLVYFGLGDGVDEIHDSGGADTLVMGEGVTSETLSISLDGNDLAVELADGSAVHLKDWAVAENRVEAIRFDDGTSMAIGSFIVPQVVDYALFLLEDGSAAGTIAVMNAFGPVSFGINQGSVHGDFFVNPDGAWEYRPADNYYGTDRAVVEVTNQWGRSAYATIDLDVLPVNDAPLAPDGETHILEGVKTLSGKIPATDVDGDALAYSVFQSPLHGVLSIGQDGTWTYEAEELYTGGDYAAVRVDDGNGGVATTQLCFDIRVAYHLPESFEFTLDEDASMTGLLPIAECVGQEFTCTVTQTSLHGAFFIENDGSFTYTPHPDYNGKDLATVELANPYGFTGATSIEFTVQPVNDSPAVQGPESVTLFGVSSVAGQIQAADVDGDPLNYKVLQTPGNGTFTIDGQGRWSFTPDRGFTGEDQTLISVEDGKGGEASTTLNFTVNLYQGGDQVIRGNSTESVSLQEVSKDDLELRRQETDLRIDIRDKGSLTLEGYFAAPENGVERLETVDGPLHLAKELIKKVMTAGRCWRPFRWFSRNVHGQNGVQNLIDGTESSDSLFGADEGDVLFGERGNDSLRGKEGDDTLVGGEGYDSIWGNEGHDTLYGDRGSDTLFGGEGDDALVGGAESDYLNGDGGHDRLFGDSGNDVLNAGSGNDMLNGGSGNDVLLGGGGDDTYRFKPGDGRDVVKDAPECWQQGGAGKDTVQFGEGVSKEDVAFFMKWGKLFVQYGEADVIEIYGQQSAQEKIERFELADGSYLTDADVNRVIQDMACYAVNEGVCVQSVEDVRRNDDLMTLIADSWTQG
jgi:Ca2+-binding RTX toxin-like protein